MPRGRPAQPGRSRPSPKGALGTETRSYPLPVAYVIRPAGALLVADGDGALLGSIIAGWDGWRGSIYRLAVAPDHRRQGLGSCLLEEAERRLTAVGARRSQAIAVETDARATAFWRATRWTEQVERLRFTLG